MLSLIFGSERVAYKLKGLRGIYEMLAGLLICLFGYSVAEIFLAVQSMSKVQLPLDGVPMWMFLAIEAVALLAFLTGAWLYYQDATDEAWREVAEMHRNTRR